MFAARGAGQKQVGHIGAGDEQHQSDGCTQDEQCGPHIANQICLQGHDVFAPASVVIRILLRQLDGNRLQISSRGPQIDARLQ